MVFPNFNLIGDHVARVQVHRRRQVRDRDAAARLNVRARGHLFALAAARWSAAGRWRYSLENERTLDSQAGLQYETCCWALRTSYRRYIATTAGEYSSGVYVQLALKGLGQIGSGGTGLLQSDSDFYE